MAERGAPPWERPATRPRRKLCAPTLEVSTPASESVARDRRANSTVGGEADRSDSVLKSSNSHLNPTSGDSGLPTVASPLVGLPAAGPSWSRRWRCRCSRQRAGCPPADPSGYRRTTARRRVVGRCLPGQATPGRDGPPRAWLRGAARRHGDLVCEDRAYCTATGGFHLDCSLAVSGYERVVVGRGGADELAHGPDRADAGLRLRVLSVVPARLGQEPREVDGVGWNEVEQASAGEITPRANGGRVAVPRGGGEACRDGADELRGRWPAAAYPVRMASCRSASVSGRRRLSCRGRPARRADTAAQRTSRSRSASKGGPRQELLPSMQSASTERSSKTSA
jgi:hypothetical protein